MMRVAVVMVAALSLCAAAQAAVYYADPNGSPSGDGSFARGARAHLSTAHMRRWGCFIGGHNHILMTQPSLVNQFLRPYLAR